ncbi:hypothetical protein NK6_7170 [Bradyrhizobium diazoefficiens]|uniref:Uncharacterized protein n=1 Tax=Bradyrhizobium diazoefficiens TaxID=1355477 RepID=A0A0E4BTF2_9BRAD|nr:hypothetical protein NK6_7170 [Bradyrhizobium diazoefficiens]
MRNLATALTSRPASGCCPSPRQKPEHRIGSGVASGHRAVRRSRSSEATRRD